MENVKWYLRLLKSLLSLCLSSPVLWLTAVAAQRVELLDSNISKIQVRSLSQCLIDSIGPFNNGFAGLCSAFITAGFSLAGTELVGLAAAETDNPRRNVPRAAKQVFWRIVLFYFTSLTVVACIVPFNHPQLLSKAHSADVRASPFVIAIQDAGIKVLPHIINAVILISVLSVG